MAVFVIDVKLFGSTLSARTCHVLIQTSEGAEVEYFVFTGVRKIITIYASKCYTSSRTFTVQPF